MSHFSGQKVTFWVTFRVTFGGDPESHFLVTFELLLIFRGFGASRRSGTSQVKSRFSENSESRASTLVFQKTLQTREQYPSRFWRQIWRVAGRELGSPELLESPRTSPEVPRTSPEVFRRLRRRFSHWNLTAIQRFPRKFPRLPRKFPELPWKFP